MRVATLSRRSLRFHWRTNLAVTLGVAVGSTTLIGALMVGDSMQASLREIALGRLGRIDHALVSVRFVREELADDLARSGGFADHFGEAVPVIILRGGVTHAASRARVSRVNVFGVDARFWELDPSTDETPPVMPTWRTAPTGRTVVLNERLAHELGARVGDDVLVRVGRPRAISPETLLGRRDQNVVNLRLTVQAVIPGRGFGAFSLRPDQRIPHNAYVPLATLQQLVKQSRRINAILVSGKDPSKRTSPDAEVKALDAMLREQLTLQDVGLHIRRDEQRGYISLESNRFLLEPAVERAARSAAEALDVASVPVLTYLANEIAMESPPQQEESPSRSGRSAIPYSTITGFGPLLSTDRIVVDPSSDAAGIAPWAQASALGRLEPGGILLNEWAAEDLKAKVGDRLSLEYYMTGSFGRLETRHVSLVLKAVVPFDRVTDDPGWTPEYPGVTDADSIADWDPPFPVDLTKVLDRDEEYWRRRRATPKAFVTLEDAQRLWTQDADRFGRLTAFRCYPSSDLSLSRVADRFEEEFLNRVSPAAMGLRFEPVRQQALSAGAGSTDFGMLFVGFSFFLIISAAMLVALLFRLGVQRRSSEVGLLLAVGWPPRRVAGLLLREGAAPAVVGGVLGLFGAFVFAWVMLAGLRSSWSDAVRTDALHVHVSGASMVAGYASSVAVAMLAVAWALSGLTRRPVRALMAGPTAADNSPHLAAATGSAVGIQRLRLASPTVVAILAIAVAAASLVLPRMTEGMSESVGFFCCGAAMLVAALAGLARLMQSPARRVLHRPGLWAVPRLGLRNLPRHPGRSLLTIGLVASATFLIAAIEAFRIDPHAPSEDRTSGTGGFSLLAESALPLTFDLNTPDGRDALGLVVESPDVLDDVAFLAFRLREGDQTSCLNLYKPTNPRILGATEAMIERGGFAFASTRAESPEERENPWVLLERSFADGAIPVIGDEAAVKWQLHLGLGRDLTITDERGRDRVLRFVALLQGSVLQGELVIAERRFEALFPSQSGYAFYLIDAPLDRADEAARYLEHRLESFGFDVTSTALRLADYSAVQNTYLSTFQTLGGLGLVLGTFGLAAVLLRNVWERRSELALMRAVGFSTASLGWMVLIENAALVAIGLAAGLVPAAVAVAPHLAQRAQTIPWTSLGGTLAAVWIVGVAAGAVALIPALRTPLLPALRTE